MQHFLFPGLIALLLFTTVVSNAQDVGQLLTAKGYLEMKSSPEKIAQIRELERKGWYHQDDFADHNGNPFEVRKVDLSPFVDAMGEPVFWVTDISPEFPGGAVSLDDYLQNQLGSLIVKPNESAQNTLFVKFSVQKDGKIEEVEPASPFPEWVRNATKQKCMEAVREMPDWSPGIFKGQAVKTKMLMVFSLRE